MGNRSQAAIFAKNLRDKRRELGLTQKELAELLCYSEKSVSKWESGTVIAPSSILLRLAEVLATDVDALLRGSEATRYYLGIDGGGTKTDFLLCDSEGKRISSLTLGASNPVDIGLQASEALLTEGISTVCKSVPLRQVSAFVGIAGGITGSNRAAIARFLERFRFSACDNGSDSQNAVTAALGDADGTVVICGTGTIAYARKGGVLRRIGGYGYLFENGGSGYMLGRNAIFRALRAEEGSCLPSALTELVRMRFGGEILPHLSEIYEGGKRYIASFAPLVFEAIDAGDLIAAEFLAACGKEIASYLTDGRDTPERRAVLIGGITRRSDLLIPAISDALGAESKCEISVCELPPVYGALRLAGLKTNVKE